MLNVFFHIRRGTQNRAGWKSMKRRLPIRRDKRWEGMGERRGNFMEMEGYPHCYTKLHIRRCEGKGEKRREMNYSSWGRERLWEGRGQKGG